MMVSSTTSSGESMRVLILISKSMPSNVFATTGTNVSVLFFDKSGQNEKVFLIDASKLGEEYKEGNNQKRRLRDFEVEQTFFIKLSEILANCFNITLGGIDIKVFLTIS